MEMSELQFESRAVHVGAGPDESTGARAVPVYQTTSFVMPSPEEAAALFNLEKVGYIYSRLTNPTVGALQERVASLEGGVGATATASGHAAQILALLPLMGPGKHIIAAQKLYGGSLNQMGHTYKKFGWEVDFVDQDDPENFRRALRDTTRAFFIESLANPGGVVTDIEGIAAVAHEAGVPLVVDNTLATPWLCRPGEWGADIVVHSTTKFLAGHGTAVGGMAVDTGKFDWTAHAEKFPALTAPSPEYHGMIFTEAFGPAAYTLYGHAVGLRDLGASQSPMNAFLTLQGMETLSLRMERHCENALKVANFLDNDDRVEWVSYAGLPSSPYHKLAQKYLRGGRAGAVFTFGVKGGMEAGIEVIRRAKLFSLLANVGDTRSLIIHPASSTHRQVAPEKLEAAGAAPECVRLSIGLEHADDIIADLDQALETV